jgi:hypothetical protein
MCWWPWLVSVKIQQCFGVILIHAFGFRETIAIIADEFSSARLISFARESQERRHQHHEYIDTRIQIHLGFLGQIYIKTS